MRRGSIRSNCTNGVGKGRISVALPYKLAAGSVELKREAFEVHERTGWQCLERSRTFRNSIAQGNMQKISLFSIEPLLLGINEPTPIPLFQKQTSADYHLNLYNDCNVSLTLRPSSSFPTASLLRTVTLMHFPNTFNPIHSGHRSDSILTDVTASSFEIGLRSDVCRFCTMVGIVKDLLWTCC